MTRRYGDLILFAQHPPRCLLLGSDAYGLVTDASKRLAAFEQQQAIAFSTDV